VRWPLLRYCKKLDIAPGNPINRHFKGWSLGCVGVEEDV
jgi:hypothetical protein